MDETLNNNYFFNESGYEQRLLLFADILGFSDYSSKHENYSVVAKLVDELQRIGEASNIEGYFRGEMQSMQGLFEYCLLSDTLLISVPLELQKSHEWVLIGLLTQFTNMLGIINNTDLNFPFLRGAIVSGFVYHKGNIAFGPALIEAYNLERYSAKYPRIIVAKEFESLMGKEYFDNTSLFIDDEDYYVINVYDADFGDVLHRMREDGDYYCPGAEYGEQHLHAWKNKIENGLKSPYGDKYDYLKKQWNRQVDIFCKIDVVKECSWLCEELQIK